MIAETFFLKFAFCGAGIEFGVFCIALSAGAATEGFKVMARYFGRVH